MHSPALQQKFQALVDAHRGIVFKVCRAYCRNAADRDDLAQEIIIALWESFERFDDRRAQFSTWMYRVALNTAISFARKETTRRRHVIDADQRVMIEAVDDAASQAAVVDIGPLYGFIERLDPLNKALILLYLDDKSHAEIAEVLGISVSNVGTRISRLRQTMKQTVQTDCP